MPSALDYKAPDEFNSERVAYCCAPHGAKSTIGLKLVCFKTIILRQLRFYLNI
jgi:hypothetical protein